MYRYKVTVGDRVAYYDLTLPMLQGMYSYVMLLENSNRLPNLKNIGMNSEDPLLLRSSSSSYFQPIFNPLTYTMPTRVEDDHPRFITNESQGANGYAITMPGLFSRIRSYNILTLLIVVTDNMEEYLVGLLLLDMWITKSESVTNFRIYDAPDYENYLLVSTISEFPLLELPPEVILIIAGYYSCDWLSVSKLTSELASPRKYLDPRVGILSIFKQIQNNIEHKESTSAIINYIENSTKPRDMYTLSGSLRWNKQVMDAMTKKLFIINPKFLTDTEFHKKVSVEYWRHLLAKYSDIVYFADPPMILIVPQIHTEIAIEGLLDRLNVFDPVEALGISRILGVDQGLQIRLLEDIVSNNGILRRTATNPVTGTTKANFQEIEAVMEVNLIINKIINTSHTKISTQSKDIPPYRVLRWIYANIPRLPEDVYFGSLARMLSTLTILPDVNFTHTAIANLLNTNQMQKIELRNLELAIDKGYRAYGFFLEDFEDLQAQIESNPLYNLD